MEEGLIGLMGGSFDPIHCSHIALAREAMEQASLHKVLFLVSGRASPQAKPGGQQAQDRLAMARLALENEPWAEASDVELRPGHRVHGGHPAPAARAPAGPLLCLYHRRGHPAGPAQLAPFSGGGRAVQLLGGPCAAACRTAPSGRRPSAWPRNLERASACSPSPPRPSPPTQVRSRLRQGLSHGRG